MFTSNGESKASSDRDPNSARESAMNERVQRSTSPRTTPSVRSEHTGLLQSRDQSQLKPNTGFLILFTAIMQLPGIVVGYALGYQNQIEACFNVKFGWKTEEDIHWYEGLIGSAGMLGMTFGAVSGGLLMQIGRRKSLFIVIAISIAASVVIFHLNFTLLLISRFLFGFAAGLYSSIIPKIHVETSPAQYYDLVGVSFSFSQTVGTLFGFLMGEFLPEDTDTAGLLQTDRWMISYIYFPVALNLVTLVALLLVVKYDSINFLINTGQVDEARLAVKQMYAHCDDVASQDYCIKILKDSMGQGSSGLTLKDGLLDERYRRATWINFTYIIFHELTGINVINLYSSQMLREMQGHGGTLTPR